jgi:hypothetical protein
MNEDTPLGYPQVSGVDLIFGWAGYEIDCGDGRNAGRVLLGNVIQADSLRKAFRSHLSLCRALPAPSLPRPDLLESPPEPYPAFNCAESIVQWGHGPTINQEVTAIVASYVEKLLAGTCSRMASYFDLDEGTLRCVQTNPTVVVEIVGRHVDAVVPRVRNA